MAHVVVGIGGDFAGSVGGGQDLAQRVVGKRHRHTLGILLRGYSAGGRMIDGFRLVIQRIDRLGLAAQQVVFEVGGITEWIDLLQ